MNYKLDYYFLYEEKRRGSYFYLLNLRDGSLVRSNRLYQRDSKFIELIDIIPAELKKNYKRVHFLELDSYEFRTGISSLFNEERIADIIIEKIVTARFITPRIHKLDYLKKVLSKKNINEIKESLKKNDQLYLDTLSFPLLKKIEEGLIKNYELPAFSQNIIRFLFPIIN